MAQHIKTALVVDDSQTERLNLATILQQAGCMVLQAASGNDAYEAAQEHKPQVIFLDILMENGDGYQTCRRLKRNPETAAIPIIMVSTKSNPVDIQWATKLGASDYIVKPYTEQMILDSLTKVAAN